MTVPAGGVMSRIIILTFSQIPWNSLGIRDSQEISSCNLLIGARGLPSPDHPRPVAESERPDGDEQRQQKRVEGCDDACFSNKRFFNLFLKPKRAVIFLSYP
jgi:hypothetical protein